MILGQQADVHQECNKYLAERTSSYWFRCRRYKAVAEKLIELGLSDKDTIYDLGAGRCDFDFYLRVTKRWRGRYIPVDGSIDGTNLETLTLPKPADWHVAIEVIEHIHKMDRFVDVLKSAKRGCVITTPNPHVVNVLSMDPTHVREVFAYELHNAGFQTKMCSLFGKLNDSILAWR